MFLVNPAMHATFFHGSGRRGPKGSSYIVTRTVLVLFLKCRGETMAGNAFGFLFKLALDVTDVLAVCSVLSA